MGEDGAPATTSTVERIGEVAGRCSWTVGCAESLTSGAIASALGQGPQASEWFRGGVVAYAVGVKHDLLGVPQVPVVSREAALAMAQGARERLGADVAVAVTGVGGPDPQDGLEPGTVWVGVAWPAASTPSGTSSTARPRRSWSAPRCGRSRCWRRPSSRGREVASAR